MYSILVFSQFILFYFIIVDGHGFVDADGDRDMITDTVIKTFSAGDTSVIVFGLEEEG
jgi:hypothetical protein